MQDKWNIDALLSEAAKQDNCALPFAQWKAELLMAAAEEQEQVKEEAVQEAPPITDELSERRARTAQRIRTFRKHVTWGFATAAAVLIVVLAASSSRILGGAPAAPAPKAMPQIMESELMPMPSIAEGGEAGGVAGAAGMEQPVQEDINSTDETSMDQSAAARAEVISLPPDENAALAIEAVNAARAMEDGALETAGAPTLPPLRTSGAPVQDEDGMPATEAPPTPAPASEDPDANRGGEDGQYAGTPIATLVSGQTYRVRTLSGEEMVVTPETAYVVGYEDNTVLYLVDAQSMEVLGLILE